MKFSSTFVRAFCLAGAVVASGLVASTSSAAPPHAGGQRLAQRMGPGAGLGMGPGAKHRVREGRLHRRGGEFRAAIKERFDTNKDGTLDQTERQAAKQAAMARIQGKRAKMLEQFDGDGNGALSPAERKVARGVIKDRIQTKRAECKAKFDLDQNGTLSPAERKAAKEAVLERIRTGG